MITENRINVQKCVGTCEISCHTKCEPGQFNRLNIFLYPRGHIICLNNCGGIKYISLTGYKTIYDRQKTALSTTHTIEFLSCKAKSI